MSNFVICQVLHSSVHKFPANCGFSEKFPGSGATTATLFVLPCYYVLLLNFQSSSASSGETKLYNPPRSSPTHHTLNMIMHLTFSRRNIFSYILIPFNLEPEIQFLVPVPAKQEPEMGFLWIFRRNLPERISTEICFILKVFI